MRAFLRRISRRTILLIASGSLAVAAVGGTVIAAAPASASATANALYNGDAGGLWAFHVDGNGNTVYDVSGKAITAYIENSYMVVRFYNDSGNNYKTYYGPTHVGRAYGLVYWDMSNVNGTFQPGKACGALRSDGQVLATACVGIY
jgi:hypothetical protein